MLFNSVSFLLFFPIVTVFYFVIPAKVRNAFLLAASLYFYMCWKAKYIVLIVFTIVVTYVAGLLMNRYDKPGKIVLRKAVLIVTLVINLLILFVFKYYNFFTENLSALTQNSFVFPVLRYALPVGISFYTFQSLGYAVDVYRKDIPAEKSIIEYALFVSFFPQLVAGPIERSSNLLPQIHKKQVFQFERMRSGMLLMLWGYFQKLVIADRVAQYVDGVYEQYQTADGAFLLLGSILFCVQIYCDFASYSNIAIGCARIMGIDLMQNFKAPYLATSVKDFWHRWHISLSTWLSDYIYIPLGGSRVSRRRFLFNLFVVFCISGLWHGANWTFLIWGLLHAVYRICEELFPHKSASAPKEGSILNRAVRTLFTFMLVCFAFIFFRSDNLEQATGVISRIFTQCHFEKLFTENIFSFGLDKLDGIVALVALFVLIVGDIAVDRRWDIRKWIISKPLPIRWLIYWIALFVIVIFGVYGPAYESAPFIYFQF